MKRLGAFIAVLALALSTQAQAHNSFERAILARSDVTHFWELNDSPAGSTPGPCATTAIADDVGAGATALASPVPLVMTTPTTYPSGATCGMGPIYFGGGNSIGFCYANQYVGCNGHTGANVGTGPVLVIPQSVFPTPPYTFFCTALWIQPVSANPYLWNQTSNSGSGASISADSFSSIALGLSLAAFNDTIQNSLSPKMWVVVTVDNSAGRSSLYVNAAPIVAPTVVPSPTATAGILAGYNTVLGGNTSSFSGQLADCGYANTAWSLSTVQYLWSVLDQNGSF